MRKSKFEEKVISVADVITNMFNKLNNIRSTTNRTVPLIGEFVDTSHGIERTAEWLITIKKRTVVYHVDQIFWCGTNIYI